MFEVWFKRATPVKEVELLRRLEGTFAEDLKDQWLGKGDGVRIEVSGSGFQ